MTTLKRANKRPVSVGDTVKVSGSGLERGWSATLIRFGEDRGGQHAVVTAPGNRGGVRHVSVDRITRRYR